MERIRTELRLLRLAMMARLRAAGSMPWILFASWLSAASLQEPLMLRRYGIWLLDDAAWIGGLFLLTSLLLADAPQPRRRAWLTSTVTVLLVALVQQAVAALLDRSFASRPMAERCAEAGLFVLIWTPLSLTLPVGATGGEPAPRFAWPVATLAMVSGAAISVALRGDVRASGLVAASVAIGAALPWQSRNT